jgi:glutathione S-transferase
MAILRYAGRLSGLYPDGLDQLNCDEILEIATEIMTGAPKHADEKEKLKLRGEWAKGALKKIFDLLEKRISERSKNGEWSAGKEFSIADLLLEGAIDMITSGGLDGVGPKFLEPYKACVAVAKKVKAHPKLQ